MNLDELDERYGRGMEERIERLENRILFLVVIQFIVAISVLLLGIGAL